MASPQRKIADDWESAVGRPEAGCRSCDTTFQAGDEYVSTLSLGGESIQRSEVCLPCFEKEEDSTFAFWRTRQARADERRRPLDINFLVDFFRRLQKQKDQDQHAQVGYIVALLLMRKKIIRHVRSENEGDVETMVVQFSKDENQTEYRVAAPELSPERMETIRDDLNRIFNLDDPADPVQDPEASGDEGSSGDNADS